MARKFRRREACAAMQGALIVERHEISGSEPTLQLKPRFPQQRRKLAVGCIEWARGVRGQTQRGYRAVVVVYRRDIAPARQLNQRSLGVELRVLGAIKKRYGGLSQLRKCARIAQAQMLSEREAVGEQALPAFRGCD